LPESVNVAAYARETAWRFPLSKPWDRICGGKLEQKNREGESGQVDTFIPDDYRLK